MNLLTALALSRRPVTILAIILVLVGGIYSASRLKIELFPDIEFPVVTVSTFYPSASPAAVAEGVSEPVESFFSGLPGLDTVRSISSENLSLVIAEFEFGTDMAEVEDRVTRGLNGLRFPPGAQQPRVLRLTPDVFPILQLSVLGDRPLSELEELTRARIVPAIDGVAGVFSVDLSGGAEKQLLVSVIPRRLAETGISLQQIAGVLTANNFSMPAGSLTTDGQSFPIRAMHKLGSVEEIANLQIGFAGLTPSLPRGFGGPPSPGPAPADTTAPPSGPPTPILLKDVAEITLIDATRRTITRTNGKLSLGLAVVKDADANLVDVADAIEKELKSIRGTLDDDIEIVTIFDQAPDVEAAISDVTKEALYGALFAVVVIFLFLFSLRSTLVAGISIPLSILVGLIAMNWLGISLNIMTLGGLAIAVGRVVDDCVVVLENVYRHIQQGKPRLPAALDATREVSGAILASTLTTIVVFAPLGFMGGIVGAFFRPFALTVSIALLASLVVALTVVPTLGSLFVRTSGRERDRRIWLQRAYIPILRWSLAHRFYTLLVAVVLFVGSFGLVPFIGTTLFGGGDSRLVSINLELPPGTDTDTTLKAAIDLEEQVAFLGDDVESYLTTVGTGESLFRPGGGRGVGGNNTANLIVRLSGQSPTSEVAESLRLRVEENGAGRSVTVSEIQGGGPPAQEMELVLADDDAENLADAADAMVAALDGVAGLENVASDATDAKPEITIDVDPTRAMARGITTAQVARAVNSLLVGSAVTQVEVDGRTVSVILRGRAEDMDTLEKLKSLPIGGVTLQEVADVGIDEGPVQIVRVNGKRAVTVTGTITGDNTRAVNGEVDRRLAATALPPGVELASGGIFEQFQEILVSMGIAMLVAILLVYLVMVASLGSLRNPLVIILSLPLASIGALGALFITGRELGVPALMGGLMLVGLVVTNAIVLITFVEKMRQDGLSVHDALMEGGALRVRPILMTAFTTIFALLPLAIFVPENASIVGAEMATLVIGGLITSTFLTLVVVPVLYSFARRMETVKN